MIRKRNPSTSEKKLRSCSKENKNTFEKIQQKTYGKHNDNNLNIGNNSKEITLENNRWKDSFDRLLDSGSGFGDKKNFNKVIRASYNQNSSIDSQISKEYIIFDENKGKKHKYNLRNDEKLPFNLDKSSVAVNNKIKKKILKKKKTAERKIQKKYNNKLKQLDNLKNKSTTASTPLVEKKFQNYLQTCGISPIRPEIKKLFQTLNTEDQKLILNYTDSIEEARNLSVLKANNNGNCENESLIIAKSQNNEAFKQNEQCNIIKNNQAGLDDEKMKYIVSYLNKLSSDYEKISYLDVSNINKLNKKKKYIIENNQNSTIQPLQTDAYNNSLIISINSTISYHDSVNNVKQAQNLTGNREIMPENGKAMCSKIITNESIIDTKMSIQGNDLIGSTHKSIISYKNNDNQLKNNNNCNEIFNSKNSLNCGQNSSNILINSTQSIENNTNSMRFQANYIINSVNNITEYLINASVSNKLSNENRTFINKLRFLQNCQQLNNDQFSKSINCLQHHENEKIGLRRHTIASGNINKEKIKKNLKILEFMSMNSKTIFGNNSTISNNLNLFTNGRINKNQLPEIVVQNTEENNSTKCTLNKKGHNNEKQSNSARDSNEILNSVDNNSQLHLKNNKKSIKNHENICDNVDKRKILEHRKVNSNNKFSDNSYNIERISEKYITRRKLQKINNNNKISSTNKKMVSENKNNKNDNNNLNNNNLVLEALENSKNVNKKENQIENLINNGICSPEIQLESFQTNCKIVCDTPSATTKRNNKFSLTKPIENCVDENNVRILFGENIAERLRLRRTKLSENEWKQSKVNHKPEENLISKNNSTPRKIRSSDEEIISRRTRKIQKKSRNDQINHISDKKFISNNEIAPDARRFDSNCITQGTPLVLLKRIRTPRKLTNIANKNFRTEHCTLNLSEKTTDITETRNGLSQSSFNKYEKLNHQAEIAFDDNQMPIQNPEMDLINNNAIVSDTHMNKTVLENLHAQNITYRKKMENNFKTKLCKIVLKRNELFNRRSKILAHSNKNIYDLPEPNEILPESLTNNKKDINSHQISILQKNTRKRTIYNSVFQNMKSRTCEEPLFKDKKIRNFAEKETKRPLNTTEKLSLPTGKWRRSLSNWKKSQIIIELEETQIPVVLGKNTIFNLDKSITENKYKLMPKLSSSYKQNTIISDQLVDKELKRQILPVQKIIRNNDRKTCLDSSLVFISEKPEAECKITEKRQTGVRKTLLLEPTDDGTPNYTTCSLFNTFAKPKAAETVFVSNRQKSKKSKRFIEIEEEDFNDLQQKDDQQQQLKQNQYQHHREEYSDESRCNSTIRNNKNIKQKYHHQLSVPICGTKQQNSSIVSTIQRSTRRGRTSIIETTNNIGFERLSSSAFTGSGDYHHHNSDREFIHSLLLNEDEQNILLCPSLNVSIRALLSPRDIVLRRCGQTDPYDFSIIYSEIELRQCRKIGEGVYGEVYMNKNRNGEAIVLKIIPIDGQIEINGEQQKNFEQILPEIIIAAELSRLRNDTNFMTSGFVEVKNVHCVQGRYPQHLIDLWELYRDNCGTENDHPEIFQDDQLYIVLELANGGQDLEAYQFQNALQSYSAFLQTALSLAVAERKFKFEHRDLHWGNILLAPTDDKEINFKFNEKIISIPTHGVKATIIDYTLSRMNFEGCCLYNDLSNDHELFTASGDYQFDIYRLMQKNLGNQWERYDPYTNILWLHYTIDKMISGARYRSSKTKKHRSAIQDMMELRDELLDYKSASDYVECLD